MSRSALFDLEAQKALVKGAHLVRDAVKVTMGPKGKTVVIQQSNNKPPVITKDGVSVAVEIQPKDEKVAIGSQLICSVARKALGAAGDGCQPYTEKILSPNGWITFADIKAGDEIFGSDGKTQKVLKVYEKEARDIYSVYFSNGAVVECTADHLWNVENTRTKQKETLRLDKIIESGLRFNGVRKEKKYRIPKIQPLEYEYKQIELSPYFMGLYIGNGCKDSTRVTIDTPKEDIVEYLDKNFNNIKTYDHDGCFRVKISIAQNPQLKELSCFDGVTAKSKFIPEQYLYNTIENREALLRGLMDTDGNLERFTYYTSSSKLAEDVHILMDSLGIYSKVRVRDRTNEQPHESKGKIIKNGISYEIQKTKNTILIDNIVKTDRKEPVRCIKVSNPDELYITSGYILTHNTSSATVLAGAIIDEGIKYTNSNAALSDIRKGINYVAEDVVQQLSKVSTPITTDEQLVNVATISANGDTKLGKIVAEAYSKVGKDGVVTIEETKERDITLNLTEGMRLDHGYSSPYFSVGFPDSVIEFDNAAVMLVDSKLTNMQVVASLLNQVVQTGTPVVIIAEGFDTPILNLLVKHRLSSGINIACVDAPGFGQRKTEILRDLGIYLGGEVGDDMLGVRLQDMKPEHFGHCEKIIIKKDETIIRGGAGNPEKIKERIETIKTAMENTDVQYDKDKLKERLGSLTTGVATIRVGGSSDEEIKELKDRLDDTMWSVKSALEEGFVPGGGRTLAYLADHMEMDKYAKELNDDELIGAKILQKAMRATFSTILENADENPAIYLKELKDADITDGYDVSKMKRVNLVEAGIIDATKVVRSSIQAATSIAGLVLTTNVVITQDPEEKSGINITGMMAPGMM